MSQTLDPSNLKQLLAPLDDAHWMLGGALRFDSELLAIHQYLKQYIAPRQLRHVSATPPCLWSLDWLGQRALLPDTLIVERIKQYAQAGIALTFSFDNPYIPEEFLDDDYGIGLVHLLSQSPLNRVWVASDALRDHLRAEFPRLAIDAHPNRIAIEKQKRTPALYRRLAEGYDRVALHPRDGARPEIYTPLAADASRYIIIANDRCLSTCPLRAEHLQQLARRRVHPYQTAPRLAIAELRQRCGCLQPTATLQGMRANLSHAQLSALYAQGFRQYALVDHKVRSMPDLLHDFCYYLFNPSPDMQHLLATLTASLFGLLLPHANVPSSGMTHIQQIPHPQQVAN